MKFINWERKGIFMAIIPMQWQVECSCTRNGLNLQNR